jgi:hypothetical protein
MKHITNIREARQMQCQGAEPCTVISITLGDLETIAQVAEANLRDKFAMSALQGMLACSDLHKMKEPTLATKGSAIWAYMQADEMLRVRNERTATS